MTGARVPIGRRLLQSTTSGALVAAGLNVTVPDRENWRIDGISVLLTTTATAGNRKITVELLDSSAQALAVLVHSQNIAASKTVSVNFGLGGYGQGEAGSTPLVMVWDGMPALVALAGQRIRVTDQAGVDITDSAVATLFGEKEPVL